MPTTPSSGAALLVDGGLGGAVWGGQGHGESQWTADSGGVASSHRGGDRLARPAAAGEGKGSGRYTGLLSRLVGHFGWDGATHPTASGSGTPANVLLGQAEAAHDEERFGCERRGAYSRGDRLHPRFDP